MGSKRAVDAAAFDAEDYTKIDRDPFHFRPRTAVSTPLVALVSVVNDVQEFGRVLFEAVAVRSDVGWACSDSRSPVDTTGI